MIESDEIWERTARDRQIKSIKFAAFMKRTSRNLMVFCKIIGWVVIDGKKIWDENNDNYRFPSENYFEPLCNVLTSLNQKKEDLYKLNCKIMCDLDIIFDFLQRLNKAKRAKKHEK